MAIYIDHEISYKYERSLEALKILKIYHDAGLDLKKVPHINTFDIYSGSFGYSNFEPIHIVHELTPYLFNSCNVFPYGIDERDGKLEVYNEFSYNNQMNPSIETMSYVFLVMDGDFSNVDLEKLNMDGSFKYQIRNALYSDTALENFESYNKPSADLNSLSTDDGFEIYFYFNKDKSKFMVTYTEDCMAMQCDIIAHVICSVYTQARQNKELNK